MNTRLLSSDLDEDEEEGYVEPEEVMPTRARRKMEMERIRQAMQQNLASIGKRSVSNFERKVYIQKQASLQRSRTSTRIQRPSYMTTVTDPGLAKRSLSELGSRSYKHSKTC